MQWRDPMKRGDGGVRKVKPTRTSLALLEKMRKRLTPRNAWGHGSLRRRSIVQDGGPIFCLLGAAMQDGDPQWDGDTYPSEMGYGPRHRVSVVVDMLAESVNGDLANKNVGSLVFGFNDKRRHADVLRLLDHTIEYAERALDA